MKTQISTKDLEYVDEDNPLPVKVLDDRILLNSTSVAYEASRNVTQQTAICYGLSGYNSKASAQFIQLIDVASLVIPADGAVPKITFTVPASSNFSITFGERGRRFATGILIVNSSTGPTKTIGSADCWFDVQYWNV